MAKTHFLKLLYLLAALLVLLPMPAGALSAAQKKVFQSGIYYFDVTSDGQACFPVGTETGNGPLYGLQFPGVSDPNELAIRINKFINDYQPNSPFKNLGAKFVEAGQKYNVNPAMMIGLAVKEQSLGTSGAPSNVINHNSFGMTGIKGLPTVNGYAYFDSFEASIDPANRYMSETYIVPGSPHYSTSILEMMRAYTPPSPEGSTKKTLDVMHKILDGIGTSNGGTVTSSPATVDVAAVAKKYGLHSAMVKQINGPVIDSYNVDQQPNAPASVLKLIIADLFLQKNPSPSESDKKIMQQMLQYSDNNAANSLMDKTGLPLTAAARQRGYNQTNIDAHYDANATKVINGTTVSDLTKAMENIFNGTGDGYGAAKEYLINSAEKFGLNSYANKWGGVAGDSTGKPVTGNSAVFEVGSTKYIITMYINERYDSPSSSSVTKIRSATNDIYEGINGSPSITTPSPSQTGCQNQNSGLQGGANGYEMSQMVSYDQGDPQWASEPYGSGKTSISKSGCGPTALAMIGATLLGDKTITPLSLAKQYGDKYHGGEGTDWALFPVFAKDYGLNIKNIGKDFGAAAQIIRSGGLVLISVNKNSYFTKGGHLMVIRAVTADGTGFYLADPAGDGAKGDSETRAFPADFLVNEGQLMNLWGFYR